MAMEPECLEPLNLVMKKDVDTKGESSPLAEDNNKTSQAADNFVDTKIESKIEDNMAILQDAFKSEESGVPAADQKFLTALYMSSLMQMQSNASSALRSVSPSPYNVQQNFMQLLAMVEARHRMWQQFSWPVPPNFLRNPVGLPQSLYDGSIPSLNEQLCNSPPNSLLTYPIPPTKSELTNHDNKETFKRYIKILSSSFNTLCEY